MTDLAERAEREIRVRHDFFAAWYAAEATEADLAVAARAFAPDMVRIAPDGTIQSREAVLAALGRARGAHPRGVAIAIRIGERRQVGPNHVLVLYEEHQRIGPERTARRTTALFARDGAAPEGVVWRHLHETWISDKTNTEDRR